MCELSAVFQFKERAWHQIKANLKKISGASSRAHQLLSDNAPFLCLYINFSLLNSKLESFIIIFYIQGGGRGEEA